MGGRIINSVNITVIYLIVSGLAIVLLVIHVFKREQYQNLMPIVTGDVIIILTFVMAGIIGYKQKKLIFARNPFGTVPFVDLVNFRSDF